MIKRMGILAALFVLFSAYLVSGNDIEACSSQCEVEK